MKLNPSGENDIQTLQRILIFSVLFTIFVPFAGTVYAIFFP